MSAATEQDFPWNQSSRFVETSTNLDYFSSESPSGYGDGTETSTTSSFGAWVQFDLYGAVYWTIVLFISVAGIAGNVLLCVMMEDGKFSRLSYAVYLKCLAVSDSWVIITRLTRETERYFSLQYLTTINSALCRSLFSFRMLAMTFSPWLVVGLTLDRCVCVCFPLTREALCTQRKAVAVCLAIALVSLASTAPLMIGVDILEDNCTPFNEFMFYYLFVRSIFSSTLPCVCILILNVLIVLRIQRSRDFRKTFTRSSHATTQQDGTTRSLVLVSVLAFITLLPVSVLEVAQIALKIMRTDLKALILSDSLRPLFVLIYTLNFGQNFFILISSSQTYRKIIQKKLTHVLKWCRNNPRTKVKMTNLSSVSRRTGSGSGSLPSVTSGGTNITTEIVPSDIH